MRRVLLVVALSVIFASGSEAKNMYIPVSAFAQGANNTVFRTDLRIFNPSSSSPIGVTIHFLPANQDGRFISGRLIQIPPRQMAVVDNVVQFMGFPSPAVGALRLDSDDTGFSGPDFVATSRTYTDSPNPAAPGTFGQFIPARESSEAERRIAVLHLSNSLDLGSGFRTNAGAMNPGELESVVTPSLYAAGGTLIKSGAPFTVPPQSVIQQSVRDMFGLDTSNGNFANGYIIFDATQPVFGYASVVDNRSSDQIFVLGSKDSSSDDPPDDQPVVVNVQAGNVFNPSSVTIKAGRTVTWNFIAGGHSTTSDLQSGPEVWDSGVKFSGTFSHTFNTPGQHFYHCSLHSVPGGSAMNGVVVVEP